MTNTDKEMKELWQRSYITLPSAGRRGGQVRGGQSVVLLEGKLIVA